MRSPQPYPQEQGDGDYEIVRLSISWGTLSIVGFVVVLVVQIFGGRTFDLRLTEVIGSTLVLSAVSFAFGLIGMKHGRAPKAARLGAFLNGVVLFCIFILLPVAFMVLRYL